MKRLQSARLGLWALSATTFALLVSAWPGSSLAQENIGKVQQGLVGGTEVDEKTQEAYGLLTLSDSCSASLLRNGWAISAAHCVDAKDGAGNAMPDPNRPGQNVLEPIGGIRVEALWGGGQTKRAVRVETFWPYDVALIQLDSPMQVNGRVTGYEREVFGNQFPYFGSPGGAVLKVFGRGISQFASGRGNSAIPSQGDGKYRVGTAKVTRQSDKGALYWYPSEGGQMIAGGDSGGPSFVRVGTTYPKWVLIGVHALANLERVPGKANNTGWMWVTRTPEAADAPIKPVWKQIEEMMGPSPNRPAPAPSTARHRPVFEENGFATGGGNGENNILYGVQQDGQLIWHRHYIDRRVGQARHTFSPTKKVGDGWKAGYKGAYPGGVHVIYSLDDNGGLRWHWHTGASDGAYKWREPAIEVGTGWGNFQHIIPMDNGVVYTVLKDGSGTLRWQQHYDYLNGAISGIQGWMAHQDVGTGWRQFTNVFSGGNGVLYGVTPDGRLMWYKHVNYKTGGKVWQGPKKVGDGWNTFTKIFSPGEGHIYGILPNGDLMYYRHTGWADGNYVWDEGIKGKIAQGWNGYASAFARITTSDKFVGPK